MLTEVTSDPGAEPRTLWVEVWDTAKTPCCGGIRWNYGGEAGPEEGFLIQLRHKNRLVCDKN